MGNNEIKLPKEIEEAFNCIDYELSVCNDELPKILNYITDLQTRNEYLETWNSEIKIQLVTLQQAVKDTKDSADDMLYEISNIKYQNNMLVAFLDKMKEIKGEKIDKD